MRRIRQSMTAGGPVSEFRRAAPRSPIVTYRLADYNEVFTLYLDAVEHALRDSMGSGRDCTSDDVIRPKLRVGAE